MERKRSDLIAALPAIDEGIEHFRRFESWVRDVLSVCFIGDAVDVQDQISTVDGSKRFEMIFDIIGRLPPWTEMREKHKTHRLLVECKNTQDPTDADFAKLTRDMRALDVHVAFLAYRGPRREPQGKTLERQRSAYINSRKEDVVVTLSAVFLQQCLGKKNVERCRKHLNSLWRDHVERWLPT
jgi:hypothetical protein